MMGLFDGLVFPLYLTHATGYPIKGLMLSTTLHVGLP